MPRDEHSRREELARMGHLRACGAALHGSLDVGQFTNRGVWMAQITRGMRKRAAPNAQTRGRFKQHSETSATRCRRLLHRVAEAGPIPLRCRVDVHQTSKRRPNICKSKRKRDPFPVAAPGAQPTLSPELNGTLIRTRTARPLTRAGRIVPAGPLDGVWSNPGLGCRRLY